MFGTAKTIYVAPVASPNASGSHIGDPVDLAGANWFINTDPDPDPELILEFAPGDYFFDTVTPNLVRYDSRPRTKIALRGRNPCRSDEPTIFRWRDNVHTDLGLDDGWTAPRMVSINGEGNDPTMERVVVENIVFEGNYEGQKQVVGPHFREGYKSLAVVAAAKTGRIRNCMIRNFGSQGFMPGSLGIPQGVESFQLLIKATAPAPISPGATWPDAGGNPDSHNWIIEDNEICNLHFAYGGYCTAIAINAPGIDPYVPNGNPPVLPPVGPRVAIVRRNTIRGRSGDPVPIGLGAASHGIWSGRVTFTDNVILNAQTGFNTDTGNLRELDFIRNMFLDVTAIGNLGLAGGSYPGHARYTVSENCVRLRGRRTHKYYNDYKAVSGIQDSDPNLDLWRPLRGPATGLQIQGNCEEIVMQNNRFTTWPSPVTSENPPKVVIGPDNFLSVPYPLAAANSSGADGWWVPNPHPSWETGTMGANWWSFVVPYASGTDYTEDVFSRSRPPAKKVKLANNVASSLPFYFTAGTINTTFSDSSGNEIASLTPGVSETSSLEHTKMRAPLVATGIQFKPIGFIGRVAPVFENSDDPNHSDDPQYRKLGGVAEVAIDSIDYHPYVDPQHPSYVVIRARVAEHRSVGSGDPTYVWKSGYVYMQLLGDQTIPGAYPYGVVASQPVRMAIDANGLATFKVNMTTLADWKMIIAPRVWIEGDPDTGGARLTEGRYQWGDAIPAMPALEEGQEGEPAPTVAWDESRDAWAEARLVVTTGPGACAVRVFTQPDVSNEKSGKRAKLIFTRTGSVTDSLAVRVTLPVNNLAGTPFIRRGTYGTSGTADYYFDWSSATYLASVPNVPNRPVTGTMGEVSILPSNTADGYVVFPANSDRIIVDVVARADDVFERETAYVRIGDSLGSGPYPWEPYLVIEPSEAAVLLYDGPTWTLYEVTSSAYEPNSYPAPTYVPATRSLAWAINHETNPKLGGWADTPATSVRGAYQFLGWWNWPGLNPMSELIFPYPAVPALPTTSPYARWHGLSTTTPTLVGQYSDRAYKWLIGGSSSYPSVQPAGGTTFSTTGGSALYGVSPNNTYMAGMATPTGGTLPPKPMRWTGGTPADLTPAGANFTSGQARGVDNTGLTVGWVDSGSQKRAFRTSSGTILTADTLNPYVDCTGTCDYSSQTWNSWAYAVVPKINVSSPYAGYAVGSATWLKLDNGVWGTKALELATFWIPGTQPLAQSIGLLKTTDAKSRALSVNDFGEVVGWSGTSEWNGTGTVTTSKAFVSRGIGVYAPVSLNDKHFVHGLTGWDLAVASSINNQGWIVGIGLKNGQTRGFLLRKLQP